MHSATMPTGTIGADISGVRDGIIGAGDGEAGPDQSFGRSSWVTRCHSSSGLTPITIHFGGMVLRSSSPASSRLVPISGSITAMDPITTVIGTGPVITVMPVHPTSTTTALVVVARAGDTPPGPNKPIARHLP